LSSLLVVCHLTSYFAAMQLSSISMLFPWCRAHCLAQIFLLFLSTCAVAIADPGFPFNLGAMEPREGDDIPVGAILNRSIQAMGGQDALDSMNTVSLHALYVSRRLVQWRD
jgi:hypothetical protein